MPNGNSRIRGILKVGIDPITIFITALATLSFGVTSGFGTPGTRLYSICDTGFYISLSVIILQVLIQQFFLKEDTDLLKDTLKNLNIKVKGNECIVFPESKADINKRIEDILKAKNVQRMKIICYGTSKFGRVIDEIITIFKNVELEVVVCSPDVTLLDQRADKSVLLQVIQELITAKNIKVYASKIPPTIRAAVMYGEANHLLWCSIQPYYLFDSEIYKLFRGEGLSPSIIADEENELMLHQLSETFEKEFERLKAASEEMTAEKLKQYLASKDIK